MLENIGIVALYAVAVYPIWLLSLALMTYISSIFYAIFILKDPKVSNNSKGYNPLLDLDVGVSILKPLMGVDKFQLDNLESHFKLNYQKLQLVLCIQNKDDPVISIVDDLRAKYPSVDCEVVYDNGNDIINPMVSNMANGYDKIKYDYIWVSTSRIKAYDCILYDLIVKAEDPGVAIVHQLPYICDENVFTNIIDKISFGGYFARNYLALNIRGICCLTGMSYLIKKKILDDVGGLPFFGKYLAEDFFLSAAIHSKGYRFKMSCYPAQQQAPISLSVYIARMTRWLRLRINMLTVIVVLFEFATECVPLTVMLTFSVNYLFNIPRLYITITYVLFCFVCDTILISSIQGGSLPAPIYKYIPAWISRECLVIVIFLNAFRSPQRVKWGRKTYGLRLGGGTSFIGDD